MDSSRWIEEVQRGGAQTTVSFSVSDFLMNVRLFTRETEPWNTFIHGFVFFSDMSENQGYHPKHQNLMVKSSG